MNSLSVLPENDSLEINPVFQYALDCMEKTNDNLFITGQAGTGKSTLLNYFRGKTKKNVAVLAPTGVAALNVNGQTIHSFFKFKPTVTVSGVRKLSKLAERDIYRCLNTIIIDEISMVRADLLDCVDRFLRLNGKNPQSPFGGIQMIFIGDLYQLPPIVTSQERETFAAQYDSPYFFRGKYFETFPLKLIELQKIYRQKDMAFIHLLNAIRNQTLTENHMEILNSRVQGDIIPLENDYYVSLTPYAARARDINEERLGQLSGKLYQFEAEIEGNFKQDSYPALPLLSLRPQAQIMMINNDPRGRWINGTMGKVLGLEERDGKDMIVAKLDNGRLVRIQPNKWEISKFVLEEDVIEAQVVGSFTQYPIALAWALTIHKSQGKTFEKVLFDIGKGAFTPGQVYVALSRCTTLEGLILKKPIQRRDVWVNREIIQFISRLEAEAIDQKAQVIEGAIAVGNFLDLLYRRADNEIVAITVMPICLSALTYQGEGYLGMEGALQGEGQRRIFRLDRILKIICEI